MEKVDSSESQKLWGVKFLIEAFFYKKRGLEKNKAVSIDKIQTFWMLYSPFFKKNVTGPDKKLTAIFLNFLRNRQIPLYDLSEKPHVDSIDAWFSSKITKDSFMKIYNNDNFDFSNPKDVVLAFNLADGILEKPEIREYAVLESLYFKRRGVDKLSDTKTDELQQEFAREIKQADTNFLRILIEDFSERDIRKEFQRLTDDVVSYFLYQKRNNYPLINIKLYELWIEDVLLILKTIIDKIKAIKFSKDITVLEKYFPNISNQNSYNIPIHEQNMFVYIDNDLSTKFTNSTNNLAYLILTIFSHVNLDWFGICANKACNQKKLFVRYPKRNREYCSNSCAAYAGTYRNRLKKKKRLEQLKEN